MSATTQKPSFLDQALQKRNRLLFFAVALALCVPYCLYFNTPGGMAAAAAVALVAFFFTVIKPQNTASMSRDIPVLLVYDACICLAVNYQTILNDLNPDAFSRALNRMNLGLGTILLAGIALTIFTPKRPGLIWLRCLGKTAIGACFLLAGWSNGDLSNLAFYSSDGLAFFLFYLICALIWILFCQISCDLDPDTFKRNSRLTTLMLVIFLFVTTFANRLVWDYLPTMRSILGITGYGSFLTWRNVLLAVFVLAGFSLATYDYKNSVMGVDALVFAGTAGGIVLLKMLNTPVLLILPVFLISSIRCIRNEHQGKRTLKMNNMVYIAVQFLVLLLSAVLLRIGLWMCVVVTGVYLLVFYNTWGKGSGVTQTLRHWLLILSAPAVFAAAFVWQLGCRPDTLVVIGVSFLVMAWVMSVLCWPHPNHRTPPMRYKLLVCAFMVVLCLLAMGRYRFF